MSFDDFVCGDGGSLAHKASLSVANKQGVYNPLFIHGKTGTGKTHLLKAIEEYTKDLSVKVKYVRGDVLVSEIITAMKAGEVDVWQEDMRKLDYLLVDDVHAVLSKEICTQEFLHLFENLHSQGKQIVMTADRKPVEIEDISDKLLSRFSWGVVCETPAFNYDMADTYLESQGQKHGLPLIAEHRQFILSRIPLSAREIQGVCVQLAAHIQLSGRKLDGQTLTVVMDGITKTQPKPKRIAVDDIMEVVAVHYGVRFNDLLSPRRTKNLAFPRHVAMYLVKELTELTLTEIGGCFGGRDHSTVLHAVNKIKNLRIKSIDIKQEIDSLAEQLALPQFA